MDVPAAARETSDADRLLVDIRLGDLPPTLRVRSTDGAWLAVHSTRDPQAEAHRQLAGLAAPAADVIVILGAGLGFITEAARLRWPRATLVVVEPLAAVADAARARTPDLYGSNRVLMVAGPLFRGADDLWRAFDTGGHPDEDPPMLAHPVLSRALPQQMADALRVVNRAIAAARMNAHARAQNAGRYLVNTLRNARHLVNGVDPARLRARFTDVPAVVVGAGPSLDRQAVLLRHAQPRALIIATDTAWRPLVRAGVHPHVVVALDPSRENGRHLRGIDGSPATWVLADGSVDPDALRQVAQRVGVFRVAAHHPWPWLRHLGVDAPTLRAWGSVLTSAFDLAVVCGCSPIVFAGADLSFTGGQPYCRGTSFEESWARHAARGVSLREVWRRTLGARTVIEVPGVTGAPVPTAPHLVEFRDWIVARAGELEPGRVINATGAGILAGSSVRQADLPDVMSRFPDQRRDLHAAIHRQLAIPRDRAQELRLRDALTALAAQPESSEGSPLDAWVRFGAPGLTVDEIVAAARDGVADLDAPASQPLPQATGRGGASVAEPTRRQPRWHAADRVAAMRARLTGEAGGLDGCTRPQDLPHAEDDDARADAARLIDDLLGLQCVATGFGEDVLGGASPVTLPLSARFEWTDEAKQRVACLEELLLERRTGYDVSPASAAPTESYWTDPIAPVAVDSHERAPADSDPDVVARRALLAERLGCVPVPSEAGAALRLRRLADAIHGGLAGSLVAARGELVHVAYAEGGATIALPLRADALMRAITGRVASAHWSGDPRRLLLASNAVTMEPLDPDRLRLASRMDGGNAAR